MNENYLWDKRGTDAEIEKMENALKAFRYQENVAPVIPVKIHAPAERMPRNIFRLGFAFAGLAALLTAGWLGWLAFSDGNLNSQSKSIATVAAPDVAPNSERLPIKDSGEAIIQKIVSTPVKTIANRHFAVSPKTPRTRTIPTRSTAGSGVKQASPGVAPTEFLARLTREEKYAYNQLMLALSITSSKLKIVKDKIDYSEKPAATSDGK